MDTKLLVCEAITDFVKTNPHSRNRDIVAHAMAECPGAAENLVERMLKAMLCDGLITARPWQIPMGLAVKVTYTWNYTGIKRIHVPASQVRRDPSVKVAEWPMPPMAWITHQLQQQPASKKYAH